MKKISIPSIGKKIHGIFTHKYSSLIIPVFLMLFITISVLSSVYWLSNQVTQTHESITLANKQTVNVQNLKNSVYNIDLYTQELKLGFANATGKERSQFVENIRYELLSLAQAQQGINEAIVVFHRGGNYSLDNGNTLNIKPLAAPALIVDIEKANEYWRPYNRLLNSFQNTLDSGAINSETIRFASDYARIFSDDLYYEFNDIALRLQKEVDEFNFYMQMIMFIGLALAILLFIYILLIATRQLLAKDKALDKARRETSDIMRTVKEGLFLVYPDYQISNEHSAELSKIIGQKNIGGQSLQHLMRTIISQKDMEMTEEFLEQLFNTRVVEDLIDDLNPLERIRVLIRHADAGEVVRYLSFKFSRVYEGKKIVRVLVSVHDMTAAVKLEEQLEKERQQHDEELEMLASILHTDSIVLEDFLLHAQRSTEEINDILRQSSELTGSESLQKKAEEIFRKVHSLKGEASALKLNNYVSLMHRFEGKLREMREISPLTGNHFLPLVVNLEQLIDFNDKINTLNHNLRKRSQEMVDEKQQQLFDPRDFFARFASDIAERNEREVELHCQGFTEINLSQSAQYLVKDLVIQLLRNAIVHGIEKPDRRLKHGKTALGHVVISLERKDEMLSLTVQDDGRGIDYPALRKKAVEMGVVSPEDAEDLKHQDLIKFMFRAGVSTATAVSEDAGQGVGSDIIAANIKALKGKLSVLSQAGTFTRFAIRFPEQ